MKIILNMTDQSKKELDVDNITSIDFKYSDNGEFKIIPNKERTSLVIISAYTIAISPRAGNFIEIKEDWIR